MADEATRWVVSAFTVVSWRTGQVALTSGTTGLTFTTNDLDLVRLVHAFAHPRTIEDVVHEVAAASPEHLTARIDDLIRAGVLTPAGEREAAASHHWDWSALAYHRRSRQLGVQKTPAPTAPAVTPRPSGASIPLLRGSGEAGRDLATVLDARRSVRAWPAVPISLETFSRFLWLSARSRDISNDGLQTEQVSRPYPSGGAVYSLEIYPVIAAHAVETIAGGVYTYLPECHCLEPVSTKMTASLPFLEAAGRSAGTTAPPIVLLVTSLFARQSESYGELAYSLVLKEVGCLFQTLYLVAEYLGLGACALGGGAPAGRLARLRNTTELAEPVVGEFMLGPR